MPDEIFELCQRLEQSVDDLGIDIEVNKVDLYKDSIPMWVFEFRNDKCGCSLHFSELEIVNARSLESLHSFIIDYIKEKIM